MSFTPAQQQAIDAQGNILLVAGAGAGKTKTLVERCVKIVAEFAPTRQTPQITRLLVVTFTDAAAAEVRHRLRTELEKQAESANSDRLREEVALLDQASISTIHSFCFKLIKEHFFELGLDPNVSVLEAERSSILFEETLDEMLDDYYAGKGENSTEVLSFMREHFNGWDAPLREFLRKIHQFTQARPAPDEWFARQIAWHERESCPEWALIYQQFLDEWRSEWLPYLESLPPENENAHFCANLYKRQRTPGDFSLYGEIMAREDVSCWPKGKKTSHCAPFEKLFTEAKFLASLAPGANGESPLVEDWTRNRKTALVVLRLAREFSRRHTAAKQEQSVLDFADLEQLSLRLLWDESTQAPTPLAREIQARFDAIFVDEYQDINAAQDRIIRALSKAEDGGNRFLVGDVKQSIYKFRQADPAIFSNYATEWSPIYLGENFRSHEAILNFINPLFAWLMRKEIGGVEYDENAFLKFGNADERPNMRQSNSANSCQVELHLLDSLDDSPPESEEESPGESNDPNNRKKSEVAELEAAEKEAMLVARRLRALKEEPFWDERKAEFRKPDWKDMVILLRAVSKKAEVFAKVFAAEGIPLDARRAGFYTTSEILDLLNLLTILDNPLQDIPLLGVLRSPIVGLNIQDLARIRIHNKELRPFWRSLLRFHEDKVECGARRKIETFLERYHEWRRRFSCASVAERLEGILADTGYLEWLQVQPGGKQGAQNIRQFLRVARDFDHARGENLYMFLRHLQGLQERVGDVEPPPAPAEDAVRLMTIHKSKGLEFPIVVVPDLAKKWNFSDQTGGFLLDDQLGFCSKIRHPDSGQSYPSLPYWLAKRRQRREALGEEMRLLYVALTRAQNKLLLFGSPPKSKLSGGWLPWVVPSPQCRQIVQSSSMMDWIGGWFTFRNPNWIGSETALEIDHVRCVFHAQPAKAGPVPTREIASVLGGVDIGQIQTALSFSYKSISATRQPAKTSVTALKRQAAEVEESDIPQFVLSRNEDGLQRGVAFHSFLQHLRLADTMDKAHLKAELGRMEREHLLDPDATGHIDLSAVAKFWASGFGRECLDRRDWIHRELAFTARFCRADFAGMPEFFPTDIDDSEFVIIQGIADLAVIAPDDIWLLDFKTDAITRDQLSGRIKSYRPQLEIYGRALEKAFCRPVSRKLIYFFELAELVDLSAPVSSASTR